MKEQGVEISSTQSIIEDARNGKMFILVDMRIERMKEIW